MKEIFPGVWKENNTLLTKNLISGKSLSEEIKIFEGKEYRIWDPCHSKPAAAIANGLRNFLLEPEQKILYLGIANGNTASFFSDIVGPKGLIYGIEVSERALLDLNKLCEKRKNIVPILANARVPKEYNWIEPVDILFQDVATSDQSEIFIRNKIFLKKTGLGMISIKARSIDVTKEPKEVFKTECEKLKAHFSILEKVELDPYEKDHMLAVLKVKS